MFDIIRFKGKPYVYRMVGKYMIGTEALDTAISYHYDNNSRYTDEMFAGFVSEMELYYDTDKEIIEKLDLEDKECVL